MTTNPVLPGHVRLVLLHGLEQDSFFYLEIPMDIIGSLCLKPLKYLIFLAWCILGTEGMLAHEHNGNGIETGGALDDQRTYYYVTYEAIGKFPVRLLLAGHCAYETLTIYPMKTPPM